MTCPQIKDVDSEAKDLIYEERVEIVRAESQNLYEFCLSKGFSPKQMGDCLNSFTGNPKSLYERVISGSGRSFLKLALLTAVISVFLSHRAAVDYIQIHLRIASLRVLPYWDWQYLYDKDCMLDNIYLEERNKTVEDCAMCLNEGTMQPDMLTSANISIITAAYLYKDKPFVFLNANRDWPTEEEKKLSLEKIEELISTRDEMKGLESCEFYTSMPDVMNVYDFANVIKKGHLPPTFMAAWDHCDMKASKVIRAISKRPFFMPDMAEMSRSNQLLVARGNFEQETFHLPQQTDQATWIHVVSGVMKVLMLPSDECKQFGCKQISYLVEAGQATVIPTRILNPHWTCVGDDDFLAVSTTFIWDEIEFNSEGVEEDMQDHPEGQMRESGEELLDMPED